MGICSFPCHFFVQGNVIIAFFKMFNLASNLFWNRLDQGTWQDMAGKYLSETLQYAWKLIRIFQQEFWMIHFQG